MIKRIILPSALPGVMTGLILAMARGAGEVAPLMVTGVVKLAPSLPIDGRRALHPSGTQIHAPGLPYLLTWASSPRTPDAAQPMVFATTLLLILLVVVMNLTAILIRNRLRKKYAASSF